MKGKPAPKIQRRVAGVTIRASLEPRTDPAGNPASDIFKAVRENDQINEANAQLAQQKLSNENSNEVAESFIDVSSKQIQPNQNLQSSSIEASPNSANSDAFKSEAVLKQSEAEIVPGNALISFGNGQMRVVSLQPPKTRKTPKPPRKMLKVVAQSKEFEKIPALFERTKAEEIYDLLYQLTLGADEPCESVRVRRSDLMASTNIKTRLTLDLNIKRLEENGLLKVESRPGEQEGNIYTVYPLPQSDNS